MAQTLDLAGQAELERPIEMMAFAAEQIHAKLGNHKQLKEVFAEREVCMRQLGRVAQAGQAHFNAQENFIRLKKWGKSFKKLVAICEERIYFYLQSFNKEK